MTQHCNNEIYVRIQDVSCRSLLETLKQALLSGVQTMSYVSLMSEAGFDLSEEKYMMGTSSYRVGTCCRPLWKHMVES